MGALSADRIKPIHRSPVRLRAGKAYYSFCRYILWAFHAGCFAKERCKSLLPTVEYHHETTLLRQLKDVDMQYQYNKIINLKVAADKLNGIVIHPGETFSYWRLLGKPAKRKGYVNGMVLTGGKVTSGVGGGLCQLSNLIYWLTLHTPLAVIERHRHGYDVFPDANRTQPFGSGATCFYPYGDLMISNPTTSDFQLCIHVGAENLEGEWRSTAVPKYRYEVVEKNHFMRGEYWGGFSRHNELYLQRYDLDGKFIDESFIAENHALMMYAPFLSDFSEHA